MAFPVGYSMWLCLRLPLGSLHSQNFFNYLFTLLLGPPVKESCPLVFLKQNSLSLHVPPSTSFRCSRTVWVPGKHSDWHSQTTVRFHSPDLKDGPIPGLLNQSLAASLWNTYIEQDPLPFGKVLFIKICLWLFFPSTVLQLWVRKCRQNVPITPIIKCSRWDTNGSAKWMIWRVLNKWVIWSVFNGGGIYRGVSVCRTQTRVREVSQGCHQQGWRGASWPVISAERHAAYSC